MASLLTSSLRRVVRHPRVIVLLFSVSLLLAWLGSLPLRFAAGDMMDHSLAAKGLAQGSDLSVFLEFTQSPETAFGPLASASLAPLLLSFGFLLFVMGGVLASYGSTRKLGLGEFFQAGGAHVWRMTKLTLLSLLPFALVGGVFAVLKSMGGKLDESAHERLGFYALMGALGVLTLLALWVRAWFDLAQARTVARDERGMFRTALRSFRAVSLRLYATYVGLAALQVLCVAGGAWLWMRVPATSLGLSFLVMQATLLAHLAIRLWQRAAGVEQEATSRP